MTALADHLIRRIRATGPLTVADYMADALLHPELGYYATRDPLGAAGDFITAPEISQTFGELIGLWSAESWERLGQPDPVLLVELGPGRGTLMADALRASAARPGFRRALRIHLVEASPSFRALQARALAEAAPTWHESLETVPAGPMLLIANEFLDALPIRQFERDADGWHERRIGLGADGVGFAMLREAAPSASAALIPLCLRGAPAGSVAEVRPGALTLAATLAARIRERGGAALFIDYGHGASACGDTLQAVRRHHFHALLEAPGDADLTAHVDFAAFAQAASAAGLRVQGPIAQRDFLSALGIGVRAARLLRNATSDQAATIESGVRRLIDPAEMGTLFKVLALSRPDAPPLAGFPESPPS